MKRKQNTLDFFIPTPTGDIVTYKHIQEPRQFDAAEVRPVSMRGNSPQQAEKKWGEKVNQALTQFKLTSFREGQRDIIMSIVGGASRMRVSSLTFFRSRYNGADAYWCVSVPDASVC